jgi:hypothetical protein
MDATYDYNRLISSRILDGYDRMLGIDTAGVGLPQPTMLGGTRMRNYILPGSTDYDYPGSLSVGTMDGKTPATMSSAFWDDFNDGFHPDTAPIGGVRAPEPRYTTMPVKPGRSKRRYVKEPSVMPDEMEGGSKKSDRAFVKAMKKVGKVLAPVAKEVGPILLKEGLKQGIKYATTPSKTPAAPAGGRRGFKKGIPDLGVDINKKVEKLTSRAKGGVLIRDEPEEFHSSVYPPALASYTPGKDAFGRGRAVIGSVGGAKCGGAKRSSARGAIVKEIMKKKGLSLPEASKYVKEHNLY